MEYIKTEESEKDNQGCEKIKLVILGSLSVGKTSLITRYTSGKYFNTLPPTCGTSFVKKKKIINGEKYILNIWDTAGQERYDSLTQLFTNNAQIAILVYSIVDKKSFDDLDKWLELIKKSNYNNNLSIGIAANKSDLYKHSVISDSKGKEYAKNINAFWKSTSAKLDDQGIDMLVDELMNDFLENKKYNNNNFIEDSFTLNDKKKEKDIKCCINNKIKIKNKEKNSIKENKGSFSEYNDSYRNTVFSQNAFNREEDISYDE